MMDNIHEKINTLEKFYFTYGTDGYDFYGGWTEVYAENMDIAVKLFDIYHPRRDPTLIACAGVYTNTLFEKTDMYKHGNYGVGCHETIYAYRDIKN